MSSNRYSAEDLPSDRELIGLVRNGSDGAFNSLLERYMPLIRFNAGRYAGIFGVDIDDLRQEAMITLFRAAKSYDAASGTKFSTYASACINNAMASAARKYLKSSRGNSGLDVDELEALGLVFRANASSRPVEDEFLIKEASISREIKIATLLSDFERRVLRLYLDGHSYQQISEILSVSTKATDNALQRVRRKLRSEPD